MNSLHNICKENQEKTRVTILPSPLSKFGIFSCAVDFHHLPASALTLKVILDCCSAFYKDFRGLAVLFTRKTEECLCFLQEIFFLVHHSTVPYTFPSKVLLFFWCRRRIALYYFDCTSAIKKKFSGKSSKNKQLSSIKSQKTNSGFY